VSAEPSQVRQWCTNAHSAYTPDRQIEGCTSVIQSARETQKNKAIAHYDRGIVYKKRGDLDRAVADFNEAIRLDPKLAYPYNERGDSYKAKGDFDRAGADFNEAIRLDPKFASAYNSRGNVYLHNRDFDRAIADYNEAIRLDPKSVIAYYNNRACTYLHKLVRTACQRGGARGGARARNCQSAPGRLWVPGRPAQGPVRTKRA
jgi:tetratricopeptide (TPR) repeat protein